MSFEGASEISLKKKTRFPERVRSYMRDKKAPEGLARDLVARDLVIERAQVRAEKNERFAFQDSLTGLANKRFLLGDESSKPPRQGQLQRLWSVAKRYKQPLSLAVIDFDNFKGYNDSLGHPAGDKALTAFAEILRGSIRETDFPARYGGEEFVVVFPQTGPEDALRVMERLRKALREKAGRFRKPVTVSIGLASFPGTEIESAQSLLEAADRAVFKAKEEGKDRIVSFS